MAVYNGKRVVFTAAKKVEVLDWEQNKPGKGEVTIQNVASLISAGTELARLYDYHMVTKPYPTNTGYISCGKVIDIGEGVAGIKMGGFYLAGSMGHISHLNMPASELVPIPDGILPEDAVFTNIATISIRAVRQANIHLGDSVFVCGLGLIGQFAQIFSRLEGGVPVVGVDLSERRRKIAEKTGLKYSLDPAAKNFESALKEIAPEGLFRVTIDSTGTTQAVSSLPARTAKFGKLIVLGGVHKPVETDYYTYIQKRSLRIIGAGEPDPENWPYNGKLNQQVIMELMKEKILDVKPLRTHFVEVEQAPEMYRMLHEEKDAGMGVVFKW